MATNPATSSPELDTQVIERELGGLLVSRVVADNPMTLVRAAHWHNLLDGLGFGLPFFLVHDLGMTLTSIPGIDFAFRGRDRSLKLAVERGVLKLDSTLEKLLEQYQEFLVDIARSELCQKASASNLSDDLLAAVIAKVLEPIQSALMRKGHGRRLPLTPVTYENLEPAHYVAASHISELSSALKIIVDAKMRIRISLEQIDLETLKLLEMFKSEGSLADPTELLDLYRVLVAPEVQDIVSFSLDLLPSILETKKTEGAQTFSIDGYASIENQGTLDNLLPSELTFDDDLFDRRYADNELFYYGRERQNTSRDRLHYILVDASASMRGLRTVFARGLALALSKKMLLKGEAVWLRFFDSRLYERQELTPVRMKVPYLLCFRSERGRNMTRVFTELDRELARLLREHPKEVVVTFISHSRCWIDVKLVESLRQKANLCGIFITPSGGDVALGYLDLLHQKYVIYPDVLSDKSKRQKEALKIISTS